MNLLMSFCFSVFLWQFVHKTTVKVLLLNEYYTADKLKMCPEKKSFFLNGEDKPLGD